MMKKKEYNTPASVVINIRHVAPIICTSPLNPVVDPDETTGDSFSPLFDDIDETTGDSFSPLFDDIDEDF